MAKPAANPPSASGPDDPFDAQIAEIGFLVHRRRPIGWSLSEHANPRLDILALALAGRARYQCAGESFEATRGTLLFFPRGVAHSARSDPKEPWSFYSVGFRLACENDAGRAAFERLPWHQRFDNFTQIADYYHQMESLWRTRVAGHALACRGLLSLLIQQYVHAATREAPATPHAATIDAIVEQMHDRVGQVASVGELAAQAGLSESRFRLLFRQMTGCSVTRFQNRLRIAAARDLLASGHYGVAEVADELGFRDVYYFSRLFKRFTGVTPSSCRQG